MSDYLNLSPALTLQQLLLRIQEAIDLVGPDADWNGWDDGSICIHGDIWLSIPNR